MPTTLLTGVLFIWVLSSVFALIPGLENVFVEISKDFDPLWPASNFILGIRPECLSDCEEVYPCLCVSVQRAQHHTTRIQLREAVLSPL